jgi:hypothetical protein
MSCGYLSRWNEQTLATNAGVANRVFTPYTNWMPAVGIDKVNAILRRKSTTISTGSFRCQLAMQCAGVRTNNPSAWAVIGADFGDDGDDCTTYQTVSGTTAGKFFVRFGVACWCSTLPATGSSSVGMQIAFDACGKIVGSRTFQAVVRSPDYVTQPVTRWIPATNVEKVKAAMIVSGASTNNLKTILAFRTATATVETPSAWTNIGSEQQNSIEHGTGEIDLTTGFSPALSTLMWIQFGIRNRLTAGTFEEATISASVAIRRK